MYFRRHAVPLFFLSVFLPLAASANTYVVKSDGADAGLEWKEIKNAFTAAKNALGNHTIQIEYAGPDQPAGGKYFIAPMMELNDSCACGNITITSIGGVSPSLHAEADHPVFRINSASAGKKLSVQGADMENTLTLFSDYASAVVDCGDPVLGDLGNGVLDLQNVRICKKMRELGDPEVPGAPDGYFLRIDNRATATHGLTNVMFVGGDAGSPITPGVQSMAILLAGPYHGDTTLHLEMHMVDFSRAMGFGERLHIQNVAAIDAYNCIFIPEGSLNSENAPAVFAETTTAPDGGSQVLFDHCYFKSGPGLTPLFAQLGEIGYDTPNAYTLVQPTFEGCGSCAFKIGNSGAIVTISGADIAHRVNMDPIVAGNSLAAYAIIQKGKMVLNYCTGSKKSNGGAIRSSDGALTGDVVVEMNYCTWSNGAGTYYCGSTGGSFAPQFKAVHTVYRGGRCESYIDTSRYHSAMGLSIIELQHCTLTSPADHPVTGFLLRGNSGDLLYAAATIFDATGSDGAPSFQRLTPAFKPGFEWKNLAYDSDWQNGGFSTEPAADVCVIGDPHLDPATGKLTNQSLPAMGAATSTGAPDLTPIDFEGDARPKPVNGVSVPDIGADEAQFAPIGVQWTTPPNPPGYVGDNAPAGTVVGTIEALDPDPGEAHTYRIDSQTVDPPYPPLTSSPFELIGNQVVVKAGAVLNAATMPVINVSITTTDSEYLAFTGTVYVTVTDETAPHVTRVQVTGLFSVEVEFSEAMGTEASNPLMYKISNVGRGTLPELPNSVSQQSDTLYLLEWAQGSGEMLDGKPVTITVNPSLVDATGIPLGAPVSGTDSEPGGRGVLPILSSIEVLTLNTLHASFSESLRTIPTVEDPLDPSHYTLTGTGQGSLAEHPSRVTPVTGSKYLLAWDSGETTQTPGDTVTLTVTGVHDLAGNLINAAGGNNVKWDYVLTSPPMLQPTLTAPSDHSIAVTFSHVMSDVPDEPNRISNPANFTLSNHFFGSHGMGTLAATPDSVVQDTVNPATYLLTWNTGEMFEDVSADENDWIKIIVEPSVQDLYGNAIVSESRIAYGRGKGTRPNLTNVIISSPARIKVVYSEPVLNVLTPGYYGLSGPGQGTLSSSPNSVTALGNNIYSLNWNSGLLAQGKDIIISVLNNAGTTGVKDLAGNLLNDSGRVVNRRIAITEEPQSAMHYVGETCTMRVGISGGITGQVFYQWVKIGAKDLPVGTNGPVLELSSLKTTDSGGYRCDISDGREEIVSTYPATLLAAEPMRLKQQEPKGGTIVVLKNRPVELYVVVEKGLVSSPGGYSYQWKHDGANAGDNSSYYAIPAMSEADAGEYYVEISDLRTTIASAPVTLDISIPEVPLAGISALAALAVMMGGLGIRFARKR